MFQHFSGRLQPLLLLGIVAACVCPAGARLLNMADDPPARATVQVVQESPRELVLEFRLGPLHVDSVELAGDAWTRVSVEGMAHTSRSGWPELPQLSIWAYLPSALARFEIIEADTQLVFWGHPLPAPEPQLRNDRFPARRHPDVAFYQASARYPGQPATISLQGEAHGLPLALVTFTPVAYDSRTGLWTVHTRLRVRIRGNDGTIDQRGPSARSYREAFERIVINPPDTDPELPAIAPRLLVVTEASYLPALQPFLDWKFQSGVPVHTILYSRRARNAAGLRDHIRALCDSLSLPPEFLLLVGDVDIVPPFYGLDNSLTDHPYSLLNDSDYLPDLAVGRIPCRNPEECAVWVQRLLAYERDATTATRFTGTVFSSATWLDPQHGIFVGDLFQSAGMTTVDRLQEPATGTLTLLQNSLNASRQWVFYIGHGEADGWTSVAPAFTVESLGSLTGTGAPIVVSVACATADLDHPDQSFAEQWLARSGQIGPLAYFGATENTAFLRSDTLGIGMLRSVFSGQSERLGIAADLGRLETAQCFPQGPGGLTEQTIQQFVLLGDPSMRVYSARPESLTVVHPATRPLEPSELTVSVSANGSPVEGALACLSSRDRSVYLIASTSPSGQALFSLEPAAPCTLQLTVTGRDWIPYRNSIVVGSTDRASLQLAGLAIADASGDQDGLLDRGESCALRLAVVNRGIVSSNPGIIRIASQSPLIVMNPMVQPLPALAPGDTLDLPQPVSLEVSEQAEDSALAMVRVSLDSDNGDSARIDIPLTLHAPRLETIGSNVAEAAGDGDGTIEQNETFTLELRLRNTGSDAVRDLEWLLLSVPPEVQILDGVQSLPWIAPGDTVTVMARLHATADLEAGYPFFYRYRLSAANLPQRSGEELRRLNQVPAFLYVLDAWPQQVDAVESLLNSLSVNHERGDLLPPELYRYASVWIFSGIFPNAVPLPGADADRLASYLDEGGRLYWEGGDVWSFDPHTALHDYFRLRGSSDGSSDAGPVRGETGSPFEGWTLSYAGENSFIDHLVPDSGATVLLRNSRPGANYPVCISSVRDGHRTVGSSIELASLADSTDPARVERLFAALLEFFGIPVPSPSFTALGGIVTAAPAAVRSEAGGPLLFDPAAQSMTDLRRLITAEEGCSWTLTNYPVRAPALELHADGAHRISLTTDLLDCSSLQSPQLTFWHYLRDPGQTGQPCAEVWASLDGGTTFDVSVWHSPAGEILEEGYVTVPDLAILTGQKNVVLRFDFSGIWYWRLREIWLSEQPVAQTVPVSHLVILPALPGVRLCWQPIPDAARYVVQASTSGRIDAVYEPIFQTGDTTFLDLDDSYSSRYYEVRAVLERDQQTEFVNHPPPAPASLRLSDLRWNRKLNSPRRFN